jgi:LPS-assembly protein
MMARLLPRFLAAAGIVAAALLLPGLAHAQAAGTEEAPVLLRADSMSYDRELGVVTASGHVEVSRDNQVLLTDHLVYNQRDDILTATGNVSLLEGEGDVFFAEYVELTGDLKNGIVRDIRIILADGARIAANGGKRTDGVVHEMSKGVYSACYLCADDPTRPPLWQVKAIKLTQDNQTHDVSYEDAWLEIKGVPVAYTPYFSHPDPTVKKRSGFLPPSMGGSSDLGFIVQVPYFFNISPSEDLTVTPIMTSDEGPALVGDYRRHLQKGRFDATASITQDSEDDIRGHIDSEGRFDINNTWRWGFDAQRSTDDTYLRRYNFESPQSLTSRLYTEAFRRRNYFSANAYAFQGLQANDDPGTTPLVLPMLDYRHVGEPGKFGGRTRMDVNLLSLARSDGTDTRRFSVDAGYDIPYTGPLGDVYTLSTSLRGDIYQVNDLERGDGEDTYNGITERLIPEIALNWRYPFVRSEGRILQVFEPITSVIVSPYGGNPNTIPNEDSQEIEFDDTNLFNSSRFSGLDRVESGPRVNYGARWAAYGARGGYTSVLVGQSYRLKEDDTFAEGSGLEDNLSDIVARAQVSPNQYLDLVYRTRLDKEDFTPRRNEATISTGPRALRLSAGYVFFDRQQESEFTTSREEWRSTVTAQINRYWRSQTSVVYDAEAKESRSYDLSLIYEDECLIFDTRLARSFYSDRDLVPSDSIIFRVMFKTLGEFTTTAY